MAITLKGLYEKYGKPVANLFNSGVDTAYNALQGVRNYQLPVAQSQPGDNIFQKGVTGLYNNFTQPIGNAALDLAKIPLDIGTAASYGVDMARGQSPTVTPASFTSTAGKLGSMISPIQLPQQRPQDIIGTAGQLAGNIATFAPIHAPTESLVNAAKGLYGATAQQAAVRELAVQGAKTGGRIGLAQGTGTGLAANKDKTVAGQLLAGAGQGLLSGAIGAAGGAAAPYVGKFLNNNVIGKSEPGFANFGASSEQPNTTNLPTEAKLGTEPQIHTPQSSESLPTGSFDGSPNAQSAQNPEYTPLTQTENASSSNNVTNKYAANINLDKLNIDSPAKARLADTVESLRSDLSNVKGAALSNQEVLDAAKSSDILKRTISRDQTLKATAAITKLRQAVSAGANGEGVSADFVKNLQTLSGYAADAGRTLNAFNIGADPNNSTIKEAIVKNLLQLGKNTDEIIAAANGVNFDNPKEVTAFYRQFVKPSIGQIVNEYRYINLLSSPSTHINNGFSNIIQATVTSPVTKLATGALDLVGSALTGKERQAYVGEVPAYTKGMINSVGNAFSKFADVFSGNSFVERPDVNQLPTGNPLLKPFQVVPRALEASDAFFRTLITGGEKEALAYKATRSGQHVAEDVLNKQAAEKAAYYIFRAPVDTANKTGQGALLSGIDQMTNAVYGLRKVPLVKWFIPFVQTPMNILKQGIEYSPAGLATIPGAANKTEQLAKSLIGSTVFAGAGLLAMTGDSTWAAPTSEKDKELFYATGRKPYSIKIGDNWVSYSKLGPLAYPIALASAVKYEVEQNPKAMTNDAVTKIANITLDMGKFLSDQSYVKSLGDLVKTAQGDTTAVKDLLANVPTQLIPLSSLTGWVSRLLDPVFRKPGSVQQSIEANIPGLSRNVPAYTDPLGQNSLRENQTFNAFSPIQVNPANPTFEPIYQKNQQEKQANAQVSALKDQLSVNNGDGSGSNGTIHKLPNGQFAYVLNSEVKTAKTEDAAKLDIAKDTFSKSDLNFSVQGDQIFRKGKDGTVTVTPKSTFEHDLQGVQLTSFKMHNNLKGWLDTAQKQAQNIQDQLQDPSLDDLEKLKLQNELGNLVNDYQKYASYGGFTKPKAVKKPVATGFHYSNSKPTLTRRVKAPTQAELPTSPTISESRRSKIGFGRLA